MNLYEKHMLDTNLMDFKTKNMFYSQKCKMFQKKIFETRELELA